MATLVNSPPQEKLKKPGDHYYEKLVHFASVNYIARWDTAGIDISQLYGVTEEPQIHKLTNEMCPDELHTLDVVLCYVCSTIIVLFQQVLATQYCYFVYFCQFTDCSRPVGQLLTDLKQIDKVKILSSRECLKLSVHHTSKKQMMLWMPSEQKR